MKSIWKGAISFGLVNIPVDLYPAAKSESLQFHLIDSRDESRIKYTRINEATGAEVPWENVSKAYEFGDGSFVVMNDEDFVKADTVAAKTLNIENFIKQEELSLIYLERPYYIVPQQHAEKPYVLLREALKKTGRVAIARVALRTKGYLAAVYPMGDALVANLIRFHDEIRPAQELDVPHTAGISDKEMGLAEALIESMSEQWQPEQYRDEYREAILKRIESKTKKLPAEEEAAYEEADHEKVIDIMELLKKSVENRKTKSETKAANGL